MTNFGNFGPLKKTHILLSYHLQNQILSYGEEGLVVEYSRSVLSTFIRSLLGTT